MYVLKNVEMVRIWGTTSVMMETWLAVMDALIIVRLRKGIIVRAQGFRKRMYAMRHVGIVGV